jgi:hypothetical protein
MTCVFRRVVPFVGVLAMGTILTACSNSGASGAVGTSPALDAFINVDASSAPAILIENRTSQPLIDVSLAIKSGILVFSDRVSRLEANEKRRISATDFTARDGSPLNVRLASPRQVAVTASDLAGKHYETTLPWR